MRCQNCRCVCNQCRLHTQRSRRYVPSAQTQYRDRASRVTRLQVTCECGRARSRRWALNKTSSRNSRDNAILLEPLFYIIQRHKLVDQCLCSYQQSLAQFRCYASSTSCYVLRADCSRLSPMVFRLLVRLWTIPCAPCHHA